MKRPIILCVEDDSDSLALLKLVLHELNCQFIGISDARESLRVLETVVPDLVILDLMLPEMNGFDIYRHMRNNPNLVAVPVIILTARANKIDQFYGEKIVKVDRYLHKPYSPKELRRVVRELLSIETSDEDYKTEKSVTD